MTLPDPTCTPGATNPDVTPATAAQTICQSGYTARIRPPVSYTDPLKRRIMVAYGLNPADAHAYELDHLVALTDGGAPADPANLWPQPYAPAPGAHQKDDEETFIDGVVCGANHFGSGPGDPTRLAELQAAVASDWGAAYAADRPPHHRLVP